MTAETEDAQDTLQQLSEQALTDLQLAWPHLTDPMNGELL